MSWIASFGKPGKPMDKEHKDALFFILESAEREGLRCSVCEEPASGLLQCRDCGHTRRFCGEHKPDSPLVMKIKQLHMALCTHEKTGEA